MADGVGHLLRTVAGLLVECDASLFEATGRRAVVQLPGLDGGVWEDALGDQGVQDGLEREDCQAWE